MNGVCQWCGEERDLSPSLQCVPCALRSLRADQAAEYADAEALDENTPEAW